MSDTRDLNSDTKLVTASLSLSFLVCKMGMFHVADSMPGIYLVLRT